MISVQRICICALVHAYFRTDIYICVRQVTDYSGLRKKTRSRALAYLDMPYVCMFRRPVAQIAVPRHMRTHVAFVLQIIPADISLSIASSPSYGRIPDMSVHNAAGKLDFACRHPLEMIIVTFSLVDGSHEGDSVESVCSH